MCGSTCGFLEIAHLWAARDHIISLRAPAQVQELAELPDPCPRPSTVKRRGLNDKDRLIYAPMADVGGLLYDKDAMYIDIPDWKVLPIS